MKLFYCILGCKPQGRLIEQHDVFFGIAENVMDLKPQIFEFWPEARGKIHLDAYQEIIYADGYEVKVVEKSHEISDNNKLYFVNLGGYERGKFQELHCQILLVGQNLAEITKKAKKTEFYEKMSVPGGRSHIDDKYAVDVDDVFSVEDILPKTFKEKYSILLTKSDTFFQNPTKIGYFKL